MELRQLRYFAAVAGEGTYVAAAARMSVAQPALWRQVRDLERELGVLLFERVGRRVRLTRDAEGLLRQVVAALAAVDRVDAAAADLRSGRRGVIAIACASPHLRRFLAPAIGLFRASHPGVVFEIREYGGGGAAAGRGIPEDLLDGLVDIATGIAPDDDARFEGFPIYDVRVVVAVPDDHAWRDATAVDVATLSDVDLVTSQPGSYSRRALGAACRRAGFDPHVVIDSPSPTSVLALGAAGLGIPITIDDALPQPNGRPWPILVQDGRPVGDTVKLMWRAGTSPSPVVSAFLDVARELVGQPHDATSA